jgi:hypothetical protein
MTNITFLIAVLEFGGRGRAASSVFRASRSPHLNRPRGFGFRQASVKPKTDLPIVSQDSQSGSIARLEACFRKHEVEAEAVEDRCRSRTKKCTQETVLCEFAFHCRAAAIATRNHHWRPDVTRFAETSPLRRWCLPLSRRNHSPAALLFL